MLTVRQIQWAATHDWFLRDNGDGTITLQEAWTVSHKFKACELHTKIILWTGTFAELRDWAGY